MKAKKIFVLLLMCISQASFADSIQPLPSITDAISNYIKSSLDANGKYRIDASQIDPRLQLPLCDQDLQVYSQAGDVKAGRNTIAVRCNGSQNWLIYNVVTVKSYKNVLVLTKPLRRNEIIHPEDFVIENREISSLTQGYILDSVEIINKQAAHNLAAGNVLNKLSYADLTLVKRGERVNIQIGKAGVSISAAGQAMMDGVKGDRINVKNMSSQRIIQAVVVDSGQVTVNF